MCQVCRGDDLNFVRKVVLEICPVVRRIPELRGVEWLEMVQCKSLEYVPVIEGLLVLVVIGCPKIKTLPYIGSLRGLKLQCKGLAEIPNYENVEKVELHNESVKSVPEFPRLKSLYLNHVSCVELPSYSELEELQIHNSKQLITLGRYEKLKLIKIQSCPKLLSVGTCEGYVVNCKFIKNYNSKEDKEIQLSKLGCVLKRCIDKWYRYVVENKET